MAMPRSQRTPDQVHDPADQVVEPVNPEEPSGQKDRLAAPSKGKKKSTSVAGPPVADIQNQMDTMFRFFSEQNELMLTKLVERIDNKLSETQSVSQPPAAKKSRVSESTQLVVTADVHQPSGNDDVIVDNEDVEDEGDDDVDDTDDNDDMDDPDNNDIFFSLILMSQSRFWATQIFCPNRPNKKGPVICCSLRLLTQGRQTDQNSSLLKCRRWACWRNFSTLFPQ